MSLALGMSALVAVTPSARADGVPLKNGDVLAAVGSGQVKHFDSSGNLLDTLNTTTGASFTTGMCFDASHNLFVTDFGPNISEFDAGGNLVNPTFVSSYPGSVESCTFNAAGDMFVGAPGVPQIIEYSPTGAQINSFTVATDPTGGTSGTDWVDLEADQCTLLYADEGSQIKSFNVCTSTQNADFATGLPGPCYELRVRPNGEVIIACLGEAVRLSASGSVVQTYPVTGSQQLFAMNLDPDGTTFWTGDIGNGTISHVDIATGNILTQFPSSPNTQLAGLSIVGGIVVSVPQLTLAPATQSQTVGSAASVTATLDIGGNPASGKSILFSVAGANTGSGSGTTNASGQASFSYTGAKAGTDTVTACYDANNNGVCDTGEATATATVTWTGATDPPITANSTNVTATEGQSFTGTVATFTDPDTSATAGEYSASIDWGDGTTTTGTISGSAGSFTVAGNHTYAEEGSYPTTVTITDTDNTSNSQKVTGTANVGDAALTSTGFTSPGSVSGQSVKVNADFTDANTLSTTADFTATIDWGDGSPSSTGTVSGGGGSYSVTGSHTYASTGYFTIKVHVADDGGSTADQQAKVLVYGTAAGGNFVISSQKTAAGTAVTFWGAQWAKLNPLSSPPPSPFKGFEDQPVLTSCGMNWKTDPGNSTPPPPGPLPAYMVVIASSSVKTAPSNAITGNTVSVVVVKTNPGYQPNPADPGTGTVVAKIC